MPACRPRGGQEYGVIPSEGRAPAPGRAFPKVTSRVTAYVAVRRRIERVDDGLFEGEESVLHVIERIVACSASGAMMGS